MAAALRQSEAYSEFSVFDYEPEAVYRDFFDGVDPEDREYLLMHGAAPHSDEEDDEEDAEEEDDGLEADELSRVERDSARASQMDEDEDMPPPMPPGNVSMLVNATRTHERPEPDPWAEVSAKIPDSLKRTRAARGDPFDDGE